jgi:hypothetical protein
VWPASSVRPGSAYKGANTCNTLETLARARHMPCVATVPPHSVWQNTELDRDRSRQDSQPPRASLLTGLKRPAPSGSGRAAVGIQDSGRRRNANAIDNAFASSESDGSVHQMALSNRRVSGDIGKDVGIIGSRKL